MFAAASCVSRVIPERVQNPEIFALSATMPTQLFGTNARKWMRMSRDGTTRAVLHDVNTQEFWDNRCEALLRT